LRRLRPAPQIERRRDDERGRGRRDGHPAPFACALDTVADFEQLRPAPQKPRVQVAAFRFDDLHDERDVIGIDLHARFRVLREIVNQNLAIMEIAEHVLRLLEVLQRLVHRRTGAGCARDFAHVPEFLDSDSRGVDAIRKIDAGRVVHRFACRGRTLAHRAA
jgi:hypothetical protein